MISIPKEFLEAEPLPDAPPDVGGEGGGASGSNSRARSSWLVVSEMTSVRSTASFFAAARWPDVPVDEVLLLSAPPQSDPKAGERLKLELRRTRYALLAAPGMSAQDRAASDAAFAGRRSSEQGSTFLL